MRAVGIVTISLSIVATVPAAAQKRLDLSLNVPTAPGDFAPAPRTGSNRTARGENPYYLDGPQGGPTAPSSPDFALELQQAEGAPAKLSLGSVGLASTAAGSYKPAQGGDPYYFDIPSQRPGTSAPGFLLKIPLGTGQSP